MNVHLKRNDADTAWLVYPNDHSRRVLTFCRTKPEAMAWCAQKGYSLSLEASGIDDLMHQMVNRTAAPDPLQWFSAWLTPRSGVPRHLSIQARCAATARQQVHAAGRRDYPAGFSFTVRPHSSAGANVRPFARVGE